jgi:hypothetical protein
VEHLKDASLGSAPALLANIRPGWKGLPGTSTLAHYDHLSIRDVKSFMTLTPNGHSESGVPEIVGQHHHQSGQLRDQNLDQVGMDVVRILVQVSRNNLAPVL